MMSLPVVPRFMVTFAEEHVLVSAVSCKGHSGDAETWKASLEPVPTGEWACVPPLLSVQSQHQVSARSSRRSIE